MKSKFVFGLFAMMLVLALAPSSFAQVNIQAFGNGSDVEITTNRTAQTADPKSAGAGILISGAAIATAPLTTTSLFIDYPANVTSSGGCVYRSGADLLTTATDATKCPLVPAGDPVRIEGATGLFSGVTISSINFSTGVVEITLPGGITSTVGSAMTGSGSFRLLGIRIDANGLTAPVTASLSMNNSANNYLLSSTSVSVINAVGAGIDSMAIGVRSSTATNEGTATLLTTGTVSDDKANIIIKEAFEAGWRTAAQSSSGSLGAAANSTEIRLTFAGVPKDVSIALTSTGSSSTLTPAISVTPIKSDALTTLVSFTGTSLTAKETLQINMTVTSTSKSLSAGTITVIATMQPIGAALSGSVQPTASDGYPKFAQADVGPVTVGNIIAASTTLLVPFAVRDGAFDTAIALSNTTADPFGGTTGGGATATAGTIRLDFYPRSPTGGAGTSFTLTTSATVRPGVGLSSDGSLAGGATWTALLSELLTAGGQTGSFTGYIFIQTSFLNAHGAPFVSDFRNFTSFTPMLVLPPPVPIGRGNPVYTPGVAGSGTAEGLSF